jgi:hypothetical protein
LKNVRGAAFGAATLLFFAAGLVGAQTKISGDAKCKGFDPVGTAEVGDRAGHAVTLLKGACTWTAPLEMAGQATKDYTVVFTADSTVGKGQSRGYAVIVMDNGDKAFVRFASTDTFAADHSGTSEGTWSYTGGTGKLKGITGKGTVKSVLAADGSATDHIEGEYALPAAKLLKK